MHDKRRASADVYGAQEATIYSNVYPMNSEYKAIMMKANDINMGFSTFKKAKGIG